jgi:hypothetical protein
MYGNRSPDTTKGQVTRLVLRRRPILLVELNYANQERVIVMQRQPGEATKSGNQTVNMPVYDILRRQDSIDSAPLDTSWKADSEMERSANDIAAQPRAFTSIADRIR